MPLLGFTKLREKLRDGSKTQTIRKPRKIPIKVNDALHVYWMLRTKSCMKIGDGKVTKVERKCLANMTNLDAKLDGFEDDEHGTAIQKLALALRQMHPEANEFSDFDIVSFEWIHKNPTFFC